MSDRFASNQFPRRSRYSVRFVLAVSVLFSMGCGTDSSGSSIVRVFAASSLTEAFYDLERSFEEANPGVDVAMAFSGSQVLKIQIEAGAMADVFASANLDHMTSLLEQGLVIDSRIFAHNELVVIVPPDNPARIRAFEDLPKAERLVIGTENVPVGDYSRQLLRQAEESLGHVFESEVLSRVRSEENNVRLVRAKVELGEADAAIVYRTDAVASDRVLSISIPTDVNVQAGYSIGVLGDSSNRLLADRWVAFVCSADGRRILGRHGFLEAS